MNNFKQCKICEVDLELDQFSHPSRNICINCITKICIKCNNELSIFDYTNPKRQMCKDCESKYIYVITEKPAGIYTTTIVERTMPTYFHPHANNTPQVEIDGV